MTKFPRAVLFVLALICVFLFNSTGVPAAASGVIIKKIDESEVPAKLPDILPENLEPLENANIPADNDLVPAKPGYSQLVKIRAGDTKRASELIKSLNKKLNQTGVSLIVPADWNGLELLQLAVKIRVLTDKHPIITDDKAVKREFIHLTDQILRLSAHGVPDARLRSNIYKNISYSYARLGCYKRTVSVQERIIALEPENMTLYNDIDILYNKLSVDGIKLFVNGIHPVLDVQPQLEAGKTIVPAGVIARALNIKTQWDPATRTVTFNKGQRLIKLVVNKDTALVNGKSVPLGFSTRLENGRIMVPLKFLAIKTEMRIHWLPLSKTIVILSK